MIYTLFVLRKKDYDIYLKFLKEIIILEDDQTKLPHALIRFISLKNTQEKNYLIYKLLEYGFIHPKITKDKFSLNPYYIQYASKEEIENPIIWYFMNQTEREKFEENYEELSKNDWELHKKLIEEGVNQNEIAKIIRNYEIEKLQEISSQENFDFNQTIEPSLYERCSVINKENVTLIDYAAFFSSVKCFKYLLMNGAEVDNTAKYAVAGGNLEIIHLCQQNNSSFYKAYEAAIKFHRNDIFKYIYENKLEIINDFEELGIECIVNLNYEIFSFLEKEGMKISDSIIDESANIGNILLVKYFLKENSLPNDI